MNASDISDAITAMKSAMDFIVRNCPPSTQELNLRTNLARSANRLSAELSMIAVEIKADK